MKYFTLILLLIFISCKNENKNKTEMQVVTVTENGINKSVYVMWNSYIESNPEFKNEDIPESDFFHNNREDANRLAELILNGKKTAGSGLYSLYEKYNADLPRVGTKNIVTDFDGKAIAITENTKVDTIPFNQILKEYAEMDMGTKIEPLEKWKKAHWDFFENILEESGEKPTEDILIVCVRFERIWPEK